MKLRNILHTNWCATIGLNWKAGGMAYVLHMPIRVYGKLRWHVGGNITFEQPILRNMLIIGSEHEDYTASAGRAELRIDGELTIGGNVRIGPDAFVGVANGARLTIGQDTFLGRDSQIHCWNEINIGSNVFMGETYMTDSTEHPIIKNGEEQPLLGSIKIGDGVYGGFRTMILRGAVIPPRSVIASGAVCTKDYSTNGSHIMLTGVPASVKATNVTAIL